MKRKKINTIGTRRLSVMDLITIARSCTSVEYYLKCIENIRNDFTTEEIRRAWEYRTGQRPLHESKSIGLVPLKKKITKKEKSALKKESKRMKREAELQKQAEIEAKIKSQYGEGTTINSIPWKAIEFIDGHIYLYNFEWEANHKLIIHYNENPFVLNNPKAKKSFNAIKEYFSFKLPQITVLIRNKRIVGIHEGIHISKAIYDLENKSTSVDWEENQLMKLLPLNPYLKTALQTDPEEIIKRLAKEKSKFFNFLSNNQSKTYRIVPSRELLSHTSSEDEEDAFIFTFENPRTGIFKLIYENINPARATIVFHVTKARYYDGLLCVYNFMRSTEINKRQRIHYKKYDFGKSGVRDYHTINHSSYRDWKRTL